MDQGAKPVPARQVAPHGGEIIGMTDNAVLFELVRDEANARLDLYLIGADPKEWNPAEPATLGLVGPDGMISVEGREGPRGSGHWLLEHPLLRGHPQGTILVSVRDGVVYELDLPAPGR